MNTKIDLILLSSTAKEIYWPFGATYLSKPEPNELLKTVHEIKKTEAKAVLFWDEALPLPDYDLLNILLAQPVDVWHAGLMLGLGNLPKSLNAIYPTWMLNANPERTHEATSWRLSLRAALVRYEVIEQAGFLSSNFKSLNSAALELGYRWLMQGVILRHIPALLPNVQKRVSDLPAEDEMLFSALCFGKKWARWAFFRLLFKGQIAWSAFHHFFKSFGPVQHSKNIYMPPYWTNDSKARTEKVGILIPTLNRYPYLRKLLIQLREQTIKPAEIIIIDQTPLTERDQALEKDFRDLPLKLIYLDEAGQCTARNTGLFALNSEYVLFLDDDDEIKPDLIEQHLKQVQRYQVSVSCGSCQEKGAESSTVHQIRRLSDVFPTHNTLVHRKIFQNSGLFDLAFNRAQRADADLGMRVYLNGAVILFDPAISVLHHHAPTGGLRTFKARVTTYASSRKNLLERQLLSVSEIYMALRYFSKEQVQDLMWLNVLGTFSMHGNISQCLLKAVLGLFLLPLTLKDLIRKYAQAQKMLQHYPQIPRLEEAVKKG